MTDVKKYKLALSFFIHYPRGICRKHLWGRKQTRDIVLFIDIGVERYNNAFRT